MLPPWYWGECAPTSAPGGGAPYLMPRADPQKAADIVKLSWRMVETTSPATSRLTPRLRLDRGHRDNPKLDEFSSTLPTTECSGVFKVMATQVKPGLTKPNVARGHQKSEALIRRQPAYSIRDSGTAAPKVRMYVCIFTCDPEPQIAWHQGASMYE
jgi:hypothetical protein